VSDVLIGLGGIAFIGYVAYDVISGTIEMMTYKKHAGKTAFIKKEFVEEDRRFPIRLGTVIDYKDGEFTLMVNDYGLIYSMKFKKNQVEFN
jgi:hypothetical protein